MEEIEIKGEVKPVGPLRSPLPKNPFVAASVDIPDTSEITAEKTPKEDVLKAIGELEEVLRESKECTARIKAQSDHIRKHVIENLKIALANARETENELSREVRYGGDQERSIQSDIARLRTIYAEIITRDQQLDAMHEELEFFERIRANSAWGERAFPHQIEGAKQMALEKRGIIADVMGLGKTLTSIIIMAFLNSKRNLIVAPNDVVSNFAREIGKWEPERNLIALGAIKDKASRHQALKLCARMEEFTVVVNYEAWRRDKELAKLLIALKFETVIIDEAHNLKDPNSINFKGLKQIIYAENDDWTCQTCGHKFRDWPWSDMCVKCGATMRKEWNGRCSVKHVYPMTGTAILNQPGDLWPLLHLVNNTAFYNPTEFYRNYCQQQEVMSLTGTWVKKWGFQYGGEARLTRRLGPKYLRRTLDTPGVPPLPPQDIQYHHISFNDEEYEGKYKEQLKVMNWINRYNAVMLKNEQVLTVPHILAILTRTRQAITWPAGIQLRDPDTKKVIGECEVEESIKVDYAEKLLTEFVIDNEQRCVLFSQFKAPLRELERRLKKKGIKAVRYDGDVPAEQLDWIAKQADASFTDKKDCEVQVILAHYKKGGVGLNFTNFTQTVVLDREWNPGKEDQAFGRTNRFGQTEGTTVHIIEVDGSIDDGIRDLINFKSGMIEGMNEQVVRQSLIEYLKQKFEESPG